MGFPGGIHLPMQEMQKIPVQCLGQEDPQRRKWEPAPVFLPGKFHGQRRLAGYSPWAAQSDMSERPSTHTHLDILTFLWDQCYWECAPQILFFFERGGFESPIHGVFPASSFFHFHEDFIYKMQFIYKVQLLISTFYFFTFFLTIVDLQCCISFRYTTK